MGVRKKLLRDLKDGPYFVRDFLKYKIDNIVSTGKVTNGRIAPEVYKAFEEAEWFALDAPIDEDEYMDLLHEYSVLYEAGLAELPYERILFEWRVILKGQTESDSVSYLVYVGRGPDMEGKELDAMTLAHTQDGPRWCFLRDPAESSDWADREDEYPFAITGAMVLIALLNVKGVAVERRPLGGKKLDLIARRKPENWKHTIHLDRARRSSTRSVRQEQPTERHRMRLHWRRGHMRDQRYGVGYRKTKRIFIHPMLIGYKEEGVIEHEYEVIV